MWAILDFEFGRTVINGADCIAHSNSKRRETLIKSNRTRGSGFKFMGSGELLKDQDGDITTARQVH
jgi:hypothetical protein